MQQLKIDIVSDVSCPWCIIGYKGLLGALEELSDSLEAEIEWHPFELTPSMPSEGQDVVEHLTEKYGITVEQSEQNREAIKERGSSVGYEFGHRGGGRIYNTFDAHRLLNWSREYGKQTRLKLALFDLYFVDSGNPSSHKQLLDVVEAVGLPVDEARSILASDRYQERVREQERHYRNMGISSVPTFIINDHYLISGGQPVAAFKKALQNIAAENSSG